MESLEMRQQIDLYIDQLPPEKLLVVADFLGYLLSKEENNDVTKELLNIDGIEELYQNAKDNISQGKVVNARQLKRKY